MPLTCTFFQFNAYFIQFNASSSTSLHPQHKENTETVTCSFQHKSVSPILLNELTALKGKSNQWSTGADGKPVPGSSWSRTEIQWKCTCYVAFANTLQWCCMLMPVRGGLQLCEDVQALNCLENSLE